MSRIRYTLSKNFGEFNDDKVVLYPFDSVVIGEEHQVY